MNELPHTCDEDPIGLLKRFMGIENTTCPECLRRYRRVELSLLRVGVSNGRSSQRKEELGTQPKEDNQ